MLLPPCARGRRCPRRGARARSGRDRGASRCSRDEAAAIQVFEAIIVAVLILTAVLFFTSLQRPTQAQDSGGIDLGVLASDVLQVLTQTTFDDPANETANPAACPSDPAPEPDDQLLLEEWIDRIMTGGTCGAAVAADVDTFMNNVLGSGLRYAIRLDNGYEPLQLLPYQKSVVPLAARAATTYVLEDWDFNAGQTAIDVRPGGPVPVSGVPACAAWTDLVSPVGTATGPIANDWLAHWMEVCDDPVPEAEKRVPPDVPYGVWTVAGGTCPCYLRVTVDGSTWAQPTPYGLQLLLWQGA
jgi:hypothetical protein